MNTGEPGLAGLYSAERRVLEIQTKLHRRASDDPHRRFDDLCNLVTDPAVLLVGWDRARGNKGARTAGVDGETARYIEAVRGVEGFLAELRADLKARMVRPLPARRRAIPKAGGNVRYLGIATIRDRVAQACLKLVLEPVFEADFLPCSYGFRPGRRAHDAVAEIHHFASRSYEWVVEGDIKACFDEISHCALLERCGDEPGRSARPGPGEGVPHGGHPHRGGHAGDTSAGTPQGSILSPLIFNIAMTALDDPGSSRFQQEPDRCGWPDPGLSSNPDVVRAEIDLGWSGLVWSLPAAPRSGGQGQRWV